MRACRSTNVKESTSSWSRQQGRHHSSHEQHPSCARPPNTTHTHQKHSTERVHHGVSHRLATNTWPACVVCRQHTQEPCTHTPHMRHADAHTSDLHAADALAQLMATAFNSRTSLPPGQSRQAANTRHSLCCLLLPMLPVAAPLEHIKLAHNTRQGLRQAAASLDNKHADRRDAVPQQRKTHTGCHHSLHTGYTRTPGPTHCCHCNH